MKCKAQARGSLGHPHRLHLETAHGNTIHAKQTERARIPALNRVLGRVRRIRMSYCTVRRIVLVAVVVPDVPVRVMV